MTLQLNFENIFFCSLFLVSEILAVLPIEPNGILHSFQLIILRIIKSTKKEITTQTTHEDSGEMKTIEF
jgi:hypothetical protein